MDVFVSPMMRHVLLSYSTILKWLLPICIVITMIVFILVVFVLYTEVLCLSFPPLLHGFVPLAPLPSLSYRSVL